MFSLLTKKIEVAIKKQKANQAVAAERPSVTAGGRAGKGGGCREMGAG